MRRKGFTLIELMIVVAIIAILASIAIPQYKKFQLKAKTSEAKSNIGAIRSAEETYSAETDTFVACDWTPATVPGAAPADFTGGGASDFDKIGFKPAGKVYYSYAVGSGSDISSFDVTTNALATDGTDIVIIAEGDLDNNGGHGGSPDPSNNTDDGVFWCTDENPKIVNEHPSAF